MPLTSFIHEVLFLSCHQYSLMSSIPSPIRTDSSLSMLKKNVQKTGEIFIRERGKEPIKSEHPPFLIHSSCSLNFSWKDGCRLAQVKLLCKGWFHLLKKVLFQCSLLCCFMLMQAVIQLGVGKRTGCG